MTDSSTPDHDPTGIESYVDNSYLTNYQLTIAAAWASAWTSEDLLAALNPNSPDCWDDKLQQTFVSVVLANEAFFSTKMPDVLTRVKELAAGLTPRRHLFELRDSGSVRPALDSATTAEAWAAVDPAHVEAFFDSSDPSTYGTDTQRASFLEMLTAHEDIFQATPRGREIVRIARGSLSSAVSV